ncbi:MAG: M42 family peptidase [Thermotogota bacterium]
MDAARAWREQIRPYAEKVWTDSHGNSFGCVNEEGRPRVMLAAHIDELALQITDIDESGFLYFVGAGRWDTQGLPGQRVDILGSDGPVRGVVCRKAAHLLSPTEQETAVSFSDLWIDIGATDAAEAKRRVQIGGLAVFSSGLELLHDRLVVGSGLDNRVGTFVVVEAMRRLAEMELSAAVFAVATVQEEVGKRGATTSAYSVAPDVGIAVDVGWATDTPGDREARKRVGRAFLGKGPMLAAGYTVNPRLLNLLVQTAEAEGIPYQIAPGPYGTDANAIQISRGGVASALISIPTRAMHSASEIVHGEDLEHAAQLVAAVVSRLDRECRFSEE